MSFTAPRKFRTVFRWRVCLLGLSLLGAQTATANDLALLTHLSAVSATLGEAERATLARIPDLDRRLLALRAYVRAGEHAERRWSWSDEEIERYTRSPEYRKLLADLDRVRNEFERRNPGYTLYANTQVRSLDVQLERWNSNVRVAKTAANLKAAARSTLSSHSIEPTSTSVARFKTFLASWRPHPVAPLAAPGLSAHGRMRAIDFAIMRNGRFVAKTDISSVPTDWEATGWDRRLKEAIVASGVSLKGPLQSPNEPWHYEYVAAAGDD